MWQSFISFVRYRTNLRSLPERSASSVNPFLFDFAPREVCRAGRLPDRRCALTAPFHPYPKIFLRRFPFLWHCLRDCSHRALPGTPLCGVRTFLEKKFSRDCLYCLSMKKFYHKSFKIESHKKNSRQNFLSEKYFYADEKFSYERFSVL